MSLSLKKKKKIKKLSLNQQFVYIFKKLCVFYSLAFFLYLSSLNVYLAWIKPKVGEDYTALLLNI